MKSLSEDIEGIVRATAETQKRRGDSLIYEILNNADVYIKNTKDLTDLGLTTSYYSLTLKLPPAIVAKLIDLETIENKILEILQIETRDYRSEKSEDEVLEKIIIVSKSSNSNRLNDDENKIINKERKQGDFELFISHTSSFSQLAVDLKLKLNEYAINAFVAHNDIEPTKEWQDEIEKALFSMDGLLAILTKEFKESKWCDQEVGAAIGRKIPIIPIKNGIDPYGFIGKYQALSMSDKKIETICDEIFKLIVQNTKTKFRITEAIVYKFCNSSSFADSQNNVKLLKRVSINLNEEMKTQLEDAIQSNHQIMNSFGVVDKIKQIINK